MKNKSKTLSLLIAICLLFSACTNIAAINNTNSINAQSYLDIESLPEYTDSPYIIINDNQPEFDKSDMTTKSFEKYGELDNLGRCTACIANVGKDIMPNEEREAIGNVKPTGWHTVKYENVDGKYLYNRCHLIGYQLTAENANKNNLITGTRYLNIDGMLSFENEIAEYVKMSNNHVLYRVTPMFKDDELVARGLQMEAYSVEDNGKGICFNVYCYNVQPGIEIDYKTGESKSKHEADKYNDGSEKQTFIINTSSKKFHTKDCKNTKDIKKENKKTYVGTKQSLINNGYSPCQNCIK